MLLSASGKLIYREIDQEHYKDLLSIAAIRHEYPFNFVEHEYLRNVHYYLNPNVKHISRNTLKAVMLRIFRRERQRIETILHSVRGKICLTKDMWISYSYCSFC